MTDIDTIEDTLQAGDTVRLSNIDWDTTSDDGNDANDANLPDNVTLSLPANWATGDSLADLLSDEYGFCVNSIGSIDRED